jgi:hypothetical protein
VPLPIVMPWRVMTTISAFGPAGFGIGAARGSAEAASVLGATVRPASTGRFSRLFDGLAAIPPAWVNAGKGGGRFNERGARRFGGRGAEESQAMEPRRRHPHALKAGRGQGSRREAQSAARRCQGTAVRQRQGRRCPSALSPARRCDEGRRKRVKSIQPAGMPRMVVRLSNGAGKTATSSASSYRPRRVSSSRIIARLPVIS